MPSKPKLRGPADGRSHDRERRGASETTTAETITDEQIRASGASADDIDHALQRPDRHWTRFQRGMRRGARARCADAWNFRFTRGLP
jgi:hypothetical protein